MYDTFLSLITWVPRSNRPWSLICWKSFRSSSLIDNLCCTEYIAAKLTEIRFGLLVRCTKCLHLTNSLEKLNEKFVYCKSASWHVGFNGKDSKPETYICVVSQQVLLSNTLSLALSFFLFLCVSHTLKVCTWETRGREHAGCDCKCSVKFNSRTCQKLIICWTQQMNRYTN